MMLKGYELKKCLKQLGKKFFLPDEIIRRLLHEKMIVEELYDLESRQFHRNMIAMLCFDSMGSLHHPDAKVYLATCKLELMTADPLVLDVIEYCTLVDQRYNIYDYRLGKNTEEVSKNLSMRDWKEKYEGYLQDGKDFEKEDIYSKEIGGYTLEAVIEDSFLSEIGENGYTEKVGPTGLRGKLIQQIKIIGEEKYLYEYMEEENLDGSVVGTYVPCSTWMKVKYLNNSRWSEVQSDYDTWCEEIVGETEEDDLRNTNYIYEYALVIDPHGDSYYM
jgi:hypothetical protein